MWGDVPCLQAHSVYEASVDGCSITASVYSSLMQWFAITFSKCGPLLQALRAENMLSSEVYYVPQLTCLVNTNSKAEVTSG